MSNSDVRMWTFADVVAEKSSGNGMTLTHVYIIVSVVFGVAFLIGIIAAIVYCYKKRRRRGRRKCDDVLRVRFVAKTSRGR